MFNGIASGVVWTAVPAQGEIEVKDLPKQGDTVTVNGTVFTFGEWEPSENYTTTYNVRIGRTPGECARNLTFAINAIDSMYGQAHLCRDTQVVYAMQYGKYVHVVARIQGTAGNAYMLAVSGDALDVSGSTLTGGTN